MWNRKKLLVSILDSHRALPCELYSLSSLSSSSDLSEIMMKAMQVQEANGPFVMVELPIPEPGPGQILIKVNACGVCHSDAMTKSVSSVVKEGTSCRVAWEPFCLIFHLPVLSGWLSWDRATANSRT